MVQIRFLARELGNFRKPPVQGKKKKKKLSGNSCGLFFHQMIFFFNTNEIFPFYICRFFTIKINQQNKPRCLLIQ